MQGLIQVISGIFKKSETFCLIEVICFTLYIIKTGLSLDRFFFMFGGRTLFLFFNQRKIELFSFQIGSGNFNFQRVAKAVSAFFATTS